VNVAFVSYETPFAPCGGIAAVMGRLPAQMQAASGWPTIVITPFHHRIEKTASLKRTHEANVGVPYEGRTISVNIFRYDDKVTWFFLLPEDDRFFAGTRHPYDVPAGTLLRDALFFGAAAAKVLHVFGPGKRWNLMLQDWEAATTALALADQPGTHHCFLTLHNSYDATVAIDDLTRVGVNPIACPGQSLLQRAIPLCESPVLTVSEQFALDLTDDTLQTQVLAPHLQSLLRGRIAGIDNGPFVDLAVNMYVLGEEGRRIIDPLRAWKSEHRSNFLKALDHFRPSDEKPVWGDVTKFGRDDVPWFVMAGRDDSRQKGYDVATAAATQFLERGGAGRFLFFPIPGDEGRDGLQFLRRFAGRFPEHVLAFPFIFREGFMSALRGARFGVMPSLYEPFGMANEFYLNGTVGIGRATGGITQQIVPLRAAGCFGSSVQARSLYWHAPSVQPTGLLFREADDLPSAPSDWIGINAAAYSTGDQHPDRVEERGRFALFQSMVHELRAALEDAARIAQHQPHLYFRMLAAGIAHIQQSFSWDRAAQEYVRQVV
jgi:glycogen synthase